MGTLAYSCGEALGEAGIDSTADEDRRAAQRDVVRRAQAGDRGAFEQLYRESLRRVYALCLRLCGDPSLAEEIAQDVFVRAWQKLETFRGESAFSSWLYTLTVNVALTERRSRRRRTSRIVATEDPTVFEEPGDAQRPEVGMDLERAMDVLPPGARAVFVLHDVEGYRHHEIAELTGVATGTSKAQLHRARRLLREALSR